jgi:hypothetical protein
MDSVTFDVHFTLFMATLSLCSVETVTLGLVAAPDVIGVATRKIAIPASRFVMAHVRR